MNPKEQKGSSKRDRGLPQRGRVIGHLGVAVDLRLSDGTENRARVQRSADVVVGDHVDVIDGRVVVEERKTMLLRRAAHGVRPQLLAANVDVLAILVTLDPPPRVHFIDRAAVMAKSGGITPIIVVTKMDLPGVDAFRSALADEYRDTMRVFGTACGDAASVESLREALGVANTVVFAGPSGVGKSTLTNALVPSASLPTGSLSAATGRGKHTTSKATLVDAGHGGAIIDMPGVRDFGLTTLAPEDVAEFFPGFESVVGTCRFRDCRHMGEPNCAVGTASENGDIQPARWAAYQALMAEVGGGAPSS